MKRKLMMLLPLPMEKVMDKEALLMTTTTITMSTTMNMTTMTMTMQIIMTNYAVNMKITKKWV